MEGSGTASSEGQKGARSSGWRAVALVLLVAVLILASTTGYLYMQLNAPEKTSPIQPQYIRILDAQQFSQMVGGNWSNAGGPQFPLNASNPTGLIEVADYMRQATPFLFATVIVHAFNSTLYSRFSYRNDLLQNAWANFTESGTLGTSVNYTLDGICHGGGRCEAINGIAISSVYVINVDLSGPGYPPGGSTSVNGTVVRMLMQAQLSAIPAGH